MSYYSLFLLLFILISGCATVTPLKPPIPSQTPGIYHRVEKGQTLWRISKLYDVGLDEIVNINRIPDATRIETGQLVFIPHRQKQSYVSPKGSLEDFIWPAKGKVIANFGQTFNNMINKGINIECNRNANVAASRSGKIVFYDNNFMDFGKTIIIDHQDGFSTVYARNSEVFIKIGDYVQRGDTIARAGSTGTDDRNVYLHFELRKGHIPQNPYFYLP